MTEPPSTTTGTATGTTPSTTSPATSPATGLPVRLRNFSPWYQAVSRLMAIEQDDPLPDDPAGFDSWKGRFQGRLQDLLAPWPEPVPANTEVTEEVAYDGYVQQRIVFDTEDTMSVPAYLLVPDDRAEPGSAVLAVHGHGPGKSRVCGLEPGDPPGGDYAAELARRGHVVLAPDLRCFGERADWNPPDHYGCDTNLVHQVMGGWNPLTQNLWDLARALDVLEAHPLVDPDRMGMAGFSYGATVTLVPGRAGPPGGGGRGVLLLLLMGRVTQGAVEHVRLPGAVRHARPDGARRRGRPGGPAPAPHRDRAR